MTDILARNDERQEQMARAQQQNGTALQRLSDSTRNSMNQVRQSLRGSFGRAAPVAGTPVRGGLFSFWNNSGSGAAAPLRQAPTVRPSLRGSLRGSLAQQPANRPRPVMGASRAARELAHLPARVSEAASTHTAHAEQPLPPLPLAAFAPEPSLAEQQQVLEQLRRAHQK